jgi:hypothetical protein
MNTTNQIENKFIKFINSDNFEENVGAIAFALSEYDNEYSEIDFEDLNKKYLDNPRLEKVLDVLNPFESKKLEILYSQSDKSEAFDTFIEFASIDGLNEPAKAMLDKLGNDYFFDLSYALVVNDKKELFENMSVDYIKNMPLIDLKAIISCLDETISDVYDKRSLRTETKVFLDSVRKYNSTMDDMIISFKNYEFAIKCIECGARISEQIKEIVGCDKISQSDMNKIIERLSGNKKQITMEEYSAVERRIQENIEKKRNARKFSF